MCYNPYGCKELNTTECTCMTLERDMTCLDAGLEKERTAVKRITGKC